MRIKGVSKDNGNEYEVIINQGFRFENSSKQEILDYSIFINSIYADIEQGLLAERQKVESKGIDILSVVNFLRNRALRLCNYQENSNYTNAKTFYLVLNTDFGGKSE